MAHKDRLMKSIGMLDIAKSFEEIILVMRRSERNDFLGNLENTKDALREDILKQISDIDAKIKNI